MSEAWITPEAALGTTLLHCSCGRPWAPEGTEVDLAGKAAGLEQCCSFLEASLMVTGILNGAVYTHLPIPVV